MRREVPETAIRCQPEDLHPVLRRVYAARRVSPAELDLSLARLLPVGGFAAAQAAALRLADARHRGERVLVLGDFDADGATATALCVSCMRAMGFKNVGYLVPNRFEYGYGLSPAIAEQAAALQPDIVVTVDNGVSSIAGVQRCHELGMQVIITDHHAPGKALPDADVLVNPNVPGESFTGGDLAGVGVAFYVMAALARELAARGLMDERSARAPVVDGLDLVALGTVADLVPLGYNNRILVAEGLRRIRAGRARPGIQALFAAAGRHMSDARSADLGYGIAPRLNAAGRLTDMSLGIDCLLAATAAAAYPLARQLDELNRRRRVLQARMEADAWEHMRDVHLEPAAAHCLFDEAWHEGIVGLVATRMKDVLRRPVIAFARAERREKLLGG